MISDPELSMTGELRVQLSMNIAAVILPHLLCPNRFCFPKGVLEYVCEDIFNLFKIAN